MTILGTRPEIIKLSLLIPLLEKEFKHILVHTGQHYDYEMDEIFFDELELKKPNYNLKIGSHSQAKQTALILERLEPLIEKNNPELVLVQGDTNTTLGGALTANKLLKKVIHIEAGCRAFNRQPEEYNRKIVDHISDYLFAPDKISYQNLLNEGIEKKKIFLVGSIIFDACLRNKEFIYKSNILNRLNIKNPFIILTIHRAENTRLENLKNIIKAINHIAKQIIIIFPVHPRTRNTIERYKITINKNVHITNALGYIDFLNIMSKCLLVMTDSGGIQEEALVFNKPCLILKNETEWTRLVELGKNILVGNETKRIIEKTEELIKNRKKLNEIKDKEYSFDTGVSKKIINILKRLK